MRYVLAVVLLALAIGAAAWHSVGRIEGALTSEVEAAVAAADAPGAEVVVDGLDATLTGEVADAATKARVEEAVARVSGVRQMLSQITVTGEAAAADPRPVTEVVSTAEIDGGDTPPEGVSFGASIDEPPMILSWERCQTRLNEMMAAEKIDFASSSAELEPSNTELLDAVVAILRLCPTVNVEIAGHTDASGPRDENLELSALRAEAVRAALEASGVAAVRLTAVGYGPDQPLVDNATPEGRAENRRIEFRLLDQS